MLLARGAHPQYLQYSPMLSAVRCGHSSVVRLLIAAGADIHRHDDFALERAAEKGHVEVVKTLLDAGANFHAGNDRAMEVALKRGHSKIVKLLIDAGVNVMEHNGQALVEAAKMGRHEIVSVLIEVGAEVEDLLQNPFCTRIAYRIAQQCTLKSHRSHMNLDRLKQATEDHYEVPDLLKNNKWPIVEIEALQPRPGESVAESLRP